MHLFSLILFMVLWGWSLSQYVLGRSQEIPWKGYEYIRELTEINRHILMGESLSFSSALSVQSFSYYCIHSLQHVTWGEKLETQENLVDAAQPSCCNCISCGRKQVTPQPKPIASANRSPQKILTQQTFLTLNGLQNRFRATHNCCLDYGLIFYPVQVLNTTEVIGRWLGWIFAI